MESKAGVKSSSYRCCRGGGDCVLGVIQWETIKGGKRGDQK
jgi:hypothetical protein